MKSSDPYTYVSGGGSPIRKSELNTPAKKISTMSGGGPNVNSTSVNLSSGSKQSQQLNNSNSRSS